MTPKRCMQVPRLAALHANGCLHIASWLQQAPYTHAPLLPALLGFRPAWPGISDHLQASARTALNALVSLCCKGSGFSVWYPGYLGYLGV